MGKQLAISIQQLVFSDYLDSYATACSSRPDLYQGTTSSRAVAAGQDKRL